MVLTDLGTFQRQQGDYTRGAYIIAALDAEIQSQTGGEKSFDDLFKRLNEQEKITHTSFKRAVVEVGGDGMEPRIDRYVDGNETPPAPDPPLQLYLELFFESSRLSGLYPDSCMGWRSNSVDTLE
jgi:predicted metalloprotease with PDZ domain